MKKIKVLNCLSLVVNVFIIAMVMFVLFGLNFNFKENIVFFTVLSNLFIAVASLICIPFNIRGLVKGKLMPKLVLAIKLAATMCVTITIGVVLAILGPVVHMGSADLYGDFQFASIPFIFHLVVPITAIISFLFFDVGEKTKWSINFLSIIPVTLYGIAYIINYNIKRVQRDGTYDWYGFFGVNGLAVGILLFVAVIVIAFFISLLFWLINQKLTAAYLKSVRELEFADDTSSKEENKEEEANEPVQEEEKAEEPVEEKPEEQKEEKKVITARLAKKQDEKVEEAKEEPVKEEAPVEEKVEEQPEEPVQEEEKAEEPVEEKVEEPVKEEKPVKEEAKKAPAKKAPVKKEEAKKEPAKKAPAKAPEKKEAPAKKEATKPAPSKDDGPTKVYHLTKRKEDGMWAITFVGGQKAVKLFKTKKEAEEYLATLTKNQGATALIRNSKGAKAGKFASSIKNDEKK